MTKLAVVTEGFCDLCEEQEILVDGLCRRCYEDGDGPLPRWMAALLFEEASWVNTNAWRELLDAAAARIGSEDHVTAWALAESMNEHWWARKVLEAVS